MYLFYFI
ncbi:hypothetical protein GQ607_017819 [Colletotrichum asianum]|nr:hypothetical protein GQ607_017819 [Colletotrichum asianum]